MKMIKQLAVHTQQQKMAVLSVKFGIILYFCQCQQVDTKDQNPEPDCLLLKI